MTIHLPDAIPAATLVVFRARPGGPPELLMVERAKAMVFAAGALVFPGGRIDPQDRLIANTLEGNSDEAAARIAAIRETIEEAGLALGLDPAPSADAVATIRAQLHAGGSFADALQAAGARIDPAALTPFARWRPAHQASRIFDTRFYLAELATDAPPASVDATENVRVVWATAGRTLVDADAGRVTIIYPTRRNLERLARYESFDAAVADAAAFPLRTITPYVETRGGVEHLCIPDDLGYPVTSEPLTRATRG